MHSNLAKVFIDKPTLLSYNTVRLSKQFNVTEEEVREARLEARKNLGLKKEDLQEGNILEKNIEDGSNRNIVTHRTNSEKNKEETVEHTVEQNGEGFKIEIKNSQQINDPAELLRLVNLNPLEFTVTSFWRGFRRGAWWASINAKPVPKELDQSHLTGFGDAVRSACLDYVSPVGLYKYRPRVGHKKLGVVCMFDIHLGKDSLYDYTGDFNITISEVYAEFLKIYEVLKGQNVTEIMFLTGNDYFNVNDPALTTIHGTPQDNTLNLFRTFKSGLNLIRGFIDRLKEIAPVKVILVPGNHAEYTETLLTTALASIFDRDKNVLVDDTPRDRKYFKFGKTLLGFSHGVKNPDMYSRLLPFEAKEHFAECSNYYILLGDKHHETTTKYQPVMEIDGITVMQLGALSRTDRWHTQNGFCVSRRQSYLMVFDENKGLEFQYSNLAG